MKKSHKIQKCSVDEPSLTPNQRQLTLGHFFNGGARGRFVPLPSLFPDDDADPLVFAVRAQNLRMVGDAFGADSGNALFPPPGALFEFDAGVVGAVFGLASGLSRRLRANFSASLLGGAVSFASAASAVASVGADPCADVRALPPAGRTYSRRRASQCGVRYCARTSVAHAGSAYSWLHKSLCFARSQARTFGSERR